MKISVARAPFDISLGEFANDSFCARWIAFLMFEWSAFSAPRSAFTYYLHLASDKLLVLKYILLLVLLVDIFLSTLVDYERLFLILW